MNTGQKIVDFLRSPIGLLSFIFVASRIFYSAVLEVHFDASPLTYFVQYVDPLLLKTDLIRSLWYLHFQPPLFNLFLGVILKLFPNAYLLAFQAAYLLMGYAFSISLFLLLEQMQVSRKIALMLAAIHTILPTTLLYENWLFYAYPIAVLLCVNALFLARFLKGYNYKDGILFFSTMTLLVFIHGIYGVLWYLLTTSLLIFVLKSHRKLVIRSALIPLAIVVAFTIKQHVLFDTLQAGHSYLGPNLVMRIKDRIPPAMKDSLLRSKAVPPFFFGDPFLSISAYRPFLPAIPLTGIPVLDNEKKSNGEINLNHIGYLVQSDVYIKGVMNVILQYPQLYLESFSSAREYFLPASDDVYVKGWNAQGELKIVLYYFNLLFCGQTAENQTGWFLVFSFPLLIIFGCWKVGQYGALKSPAFPLSISLSYMIFNIVYSSVITVSIPWYNYNRYRFGIDAFYLVLFGMVLSSVSNYISGRRRR